MHEIHSSPDMCRFFIKNKKGSLTSSWPQNYTTAINMVQLFMELLHAGLLSMSYLLKGNLLCIYLYCTIFSLGDGLKVNSCTHSTMHCCCAILTVLSVNTFLSQDCLTTLLRCVHVQSNLRSNCKRLKFFSD